MNIHGKYVILRAIEMSDMQVMREMMNDPCIEEMIVGWAWPVSVYTQEKWFQTSAHNGKDFRFIIEYEGNAVGIVGLVDIDWKNRKATTSIKLHKTCPKGKGIGTDSVMALERYAFDQLQLHRLEGSWLTYNFASEKLHLKCGWTIEGIQHKAIYKNGVYHDLKIVGILSEDYYALIQKNHYWDN